MLPPPASNHTNLKPTEPKCAIVLKIAIKLENRRKRKEKQQQIAALSGVLMMIVFHHFSSALSRARNNEVASALLPLRPHRSSYQDY